MSTDPRHLLDSVLEGEKLTISHIEELMQLDEGQHLEFKDGLITSKPRRKAGKVELQEAVNAFGNSAGGLLVVGVTDEPPRKISPCQPRIGAEQLDKWAENLIVGKEHFSPLPRIQVVDDGKGPILVLAVPRVPRLVPISRSGEMAYFLRLNQSTLQAPPYLLSDLMLGRRQHPKLRLERERVICELESQGGYGMFRFYFDVENDGLIRVENLLVGVVSWSSQDPRQDLNSHLLTHVKIVEPDGTHPLYLSHFQGKFASQIPSPVVLDPFANLPFSVSGCHFPLTKAKITGAVYVLSTGSEPIWYEVQFMPPATEAGKRKYDVAVELEGPVYGRPPRVSWEPVNQGA